MNEIKPIKKSKKKKVGRPKTEIDLIELEKVCRLNCTMPEIAYYFDIPLRTLEDKYTNDEQKNNTKRSCSRYVIIKKKTNTNNE